jgi:hypothetical protein
MILCDGSRLTLGPDPGVKSDPDLASQGIASSAAGAGLWRKAAGPSDSTKDPVVSDREDREGNDDHAAMVMRVERIAVHAIGRGARTRHAVTHDVVMVHPSRHISARAATRR